MAIRFRCSHCNQLLGIAESRAGASVDCPGCGRTIRVPSSKRRPTPGAADSAGRDPKLNEALSELSSLGADLDDGLSPTSLQPQVIPTRPVSASATVRTPPAQRDSRAAGSSDQKPSAIAPDAPTSRSPDTPGTGAAADNDWRGDLESLATPSGASAADAPVAPVDRRRLAVIACGALLTGLAAGVLIGLSLSGQETAVGTTGEESPPPAADPLAAPPAEPPLPPPAEGVIVGRVTWSDAGRNAAPDEDSLILLLPAQRTGRWKLDSRTIRSPADPDDQAAALAALRLLGVTVAQADTAGRFSVKRMPAEAAQLVVISRHVNQSDPAENRQAVDALSQWFENPAQLIGRLAAQVVALPPVEESEAATDPIIVEFP